MESGSKIVSANISTEPTCELAANSSQNLLPGCSSLVCLREEDVPGASLDGREPNQLLVVELMHCLKCRAATSVGKMQDLVKRWAGCTIVLYWSVFLILTSHLLIWCAVCNYITAGLYAKIVDLDGCINSSRLRAVCKPSLTNTKCTSFGRVDI